MILLGSIAYKLDVCPLVIQHMSRRQNQLLMLGTEI